MHLGYMVWFIATAVVTIVVLTVTTLAAAGILTRDDQEREAVPVADRTDRIPPSAESLEVAQHRRVA